MSRTYRFADAADRDLEGCLNWSCSTFGSEAAMRYARLIEQAVFDIAADPARPGVQFRSEFGYSFYHLRYSRDRALKESGTVKRPRHFIVFRSEESILTVVRILHESMDFETNL